MDFNTPFGIFFRLAGKEKVGNLSGKCLVQGFRSGLHMKLVVDAVYVLLNRLLADKKLGCDLFVKIAPGKEIKNFIFPARQQLSRFSVFLWLVY
jgi:hypothetical protein